MKYTKEDVLGMSWQNWNETMAKELNDKGFTCNWGREPRPYQGNINPKDFILGEVGSDRRDEIEYLKSLGLLNNGRCPLCGKPIVSNLGRFTSGFDSSIYFDICNDCAGAKGRGKVSTLDSLYLNGGCLTTLLLSPIVYVVHRIRKK